MMSDQGDHWITTYTGRFSYTHPRVEDVNITDIAYALSNICRWTGHCDPPYSVAEHSCRVYDYVKDRTKDKRVLLQALLHDATEAYTNDINKPLKLHLGECWLKTEKAIETVVFRKFGLCSVCIPIIKEADEVLGKTERRDLFYHGIGHLSRSSIRPLSELIYPWTAAKARREFIRRYEGIVFSST